MATEKCFSNGSPAPGPVPEGMIRLYSMRFCPFAQRTRLVLNYKGIKYETININLKDKPDWFLEKNPQGLVPTLETPAGEVIYESLITCEYLDEVYPEKKLLPSSPYCKARQKMMLEYFSKVTAALHKIAMERAKGQDVSGHEAELTKLLSKVNGCLAKRKTKFFGSDSVSMIDYMMWPFFERVPIFKVQNCLDEMPELKMWMENMSNDPTVKATTPGSDSYAAYYQTFLEGKPNFDYGL